MYLSIKLQLNLNDSVPLNSKNSLYFLKILDTLRCIEQEGFARIKGTVQLEKMKAGKNLPSVMIHSFTLTSVPRSTNH